MRIAIPTSLVPVMAASSGSIPSCCFLKMFSRTDGVVDGIPTPSASPPRLIRLSRCQGVHQRKGDDDRKRDGDGVGKVVRQFLRKTSRTIMARTPPTSMLSTRDSRDISMKSL